MQKLKAFSLIEVLLSVALIVSITAILGVIIFQSNKAKSVLDDELDNRQLIRLIKNLMERDINSVVYLTNFSTTGAQTGIYGIDQLDSNATTDQIHMHSMERSLNSYVSQSNDPGIHEVSYYLRKNSNDQFYSLYRRETYYIREVFNVVNSPRDQEQITNNPAVHINIVYDKINFLKFQYVGDPLADPQINWNSNTKNKLPLAVIVLIGFEDLTKKNYILNFKINIRPNLTNANWKF